MIESVEVRINDLSGRALDWAVAEADGLMPYPFKGEFWVLDGKTNAPLPKFSTDWAQGGPLRDNYDVGIEPGVPDGIPYAYVPSRDLDGSRGETALIALCRAIVSAKFGGFVKVPAVLVGGVV
ncbi:phage protein NinX family protein [Aeromonas molluscorum]|uniref:phage protein NinX family protein n=1 Tax=Aeromonas molluscorum TaxID=271417 RepID=UPI003F1B7803